MTQISYLKLLLCCLLIGSARPLPPPNVHGGQKGEMCTSENCIAASDRLFKSMNLSANPCEDFNEFACGKFLTEFVIPEDKSRWSSFTPISDTILERGI